MKDKRVLFVLLAAIFSSLCVAAVAQPAQRIGLLVAQSNIISHPSIVSIERLAMLGSPKAQFELGKRYEHGDGVSKNIIAAYAYYRLAEMHYTESQEAAISLMREMTPSQLKAGNLLYQQLTNKIIDKMSAIHTQLKQR